MLEIRRLAQRDQSGKAPEIWPLCYKWSKNYENRSKQNTAIDGFCSSSIEEVEKKLGEKLLSGIKQKHQKDSLTFL